MRPAPTTFALLPLTIAATPASAAEAAATDFATGLAQMLFGLAVVVALLLACLWAIKRLTAPRGGAGALRVLGAVPVGPRERVVLVGLGGRILVLGVAPGSVNTLHVLDAEDLPMPQTDGQVQAAMKDFPAWLKQAMERKHGH